MTPSEYHDRIKAPVAGTFRCRGCELVKPLTYFRADSSRRGHRPKCKVCESVYRAEYDRKPEARARRKELRSTERAKEQSRNRRWRWASSPQGQASRKRYHASARSRIVKCRYCVMRRLERAKAEGWARERIARAKTMLAAYDAELRRIDRRASA